MKPVKINIESLEKSLDNGNCNEFNMHNKKKYLKGILYASVGVGIMFFAQRVGEISYYFSRANDKVASNDSVYLFYDIDKDNKKDMIVKYPSSLIKRLFTEPEIYYFWDREFREMKIKAEECKR